MSDDLDDAIAERLRRFDGDMLVARTMRTPKEKEHWTDAAVQRAVQDIRKLFKDGRPAKSSPFKYRKRHLGLLVGAVGDCGAGEGLPQEGARPALRLVE
jgi:hypothetical protein